MKKYKNPIRLENIGLNTPMKKTNMNKLFYQMQIKLKLKNT